MGRDEMRRDEIGSLLSSNLQLLMCDLRRPINLNLALNQVQLAKTPQSTRINALKIGDVSYTSPREISDVVNNHFSDM